MLIHVFLQITVIIHLLKGSYRNEFEFQTIILKYISTVSQHRIHFHISQKNIIIMFSTRTVRREQGTVPYGTRTCSLVCNVYVIIDSKHLI